MSAPVPSRREYAYFRASGVFDPADMTRCIGVEPSECWAVGDDSVRRGHTHKRRNSQWSLRSRLEDTEPLDSHVGELLRVLQPRRLGLLEAATMAKLQIVCVGSYSYNFSWEPDFEHQKLATALGIGFWFDIYLYDDPHEEMVALREQLGIRKALPENPEG